MYIVFGILLDTRNTNEKEAILKARQELDLYNRSYNITNVSEFAKGGQIQINPHNHRYHILGYVKFSQKPELLATTNDKSEIKRIVNKIDFDKDKIFVTDDKEDRVVYNY